MSGVLAVDGGQSGIRLRHSQSREVVELEGVSRLEGDPVERVGSLIIDAVGAAGFPTADIAVLGLTTAPSDSRDRARLSGALAESRVASEVWIADDAVTSHVGALSGEPGVSLVVGTGVACLSRSADGKPRIFDGYGYLLGDDGGAWWIGRAGVRAALDAHAGRGDATSLVEATIERFGAIQDLHVRLHDSARPVNDIAQFAREVLRLAAGDDAVAREIVNDAADLLFDTTVAAARWSGSRAVAVALGGRMLQPGTPLRARLDELLASEPEWLLARSADGTALDGAMALGLSGAGPFSDLVDIRKEGVHE
ncbi:N-acetylglucosamine kinase-like BadF-type ATPase [Cryobacterium mesophilum]|uniref:ATPase n=1 Tax=Terrimesophilobacter mesophilus TaxID=433647 RepID=A0A4R8VB09_9MICO|nr:BadF/BadG/BcrA/BcrD ATPase family protein [Terrimesophilobacter mesophilus]MBB5633009.1 N-acetylglucosamine kinase-like BadF-type ATPase [Terrimesophilobacter mesophilus]TFB79775.1 ATPase [Terrimesophilobacter mesophilus]